MKIVTLAISKMVTQEELIAWEKTIMGRVKACYALMNVSRRYLLVNLARNGVDMHYMPIQKYKFNRTCDAYMDRARRIVENSMECYTLSRWDDMYMDPIIISTKFKEKHPEYYLEITFINDDGTMKKITLDEAKVAFRWDLYQSKL